MNPKDKFLMCPPRFYAVEYVINPWMEGNIGRTNPEAAREQWQRLHRTLQARAEVELIDPVEGLPDMAFTANSGLVAGNTFIPAAVPICSARARDRPFRSLAGEPRPADCRARKPRDVRGRGRRAPSAR